jgi:hypothetical protein
MPRSRIAKRPNSIHRVFSGSNDSVPRPSVRGCSAVSQLLWASLTSPGRASSDLARHLPDAGHAVVVDLEISQLPNKGRTYMPGSLTTQDSRRACDNARLSVAFRHYESVGIPNKYISWLNGWPTRTSVNTSRRASRCVAHDSRPARIAKSLPQGTLTPYPLPIFPTFTIIYIIRSVRREARGGPGSLGLLRTQFGLGY